METGLDDNRNIVTILKGTGIAIMITLALLLLFSLLLAFTNISEDLMSPVIIAITAVSIILGSAMATLHIKKNGILNGGVIGIIYMLVIYLLSSIVSSNFGLGTYAVIMIITGIISGMIGGIIGVNIKIK